MGIKEMRNESIILLDNILIWLKFGIIFRVNRSYSLWTTDFSSLKVSYWFFWTSITFENYSFLIFSVLRLLWETNFNNTKTCTTQVYTILEVTREYYKPTDVYHFHHSWNCYIELWCIFRLYLLLMYYSYFWNNFSLTD